MNNAGKSRPPRNGARLTLGDVAFPISGAVFCFAGFALLHEAFLKNPSNLGHEMFSAALASIMTALCLGMLMRAQAKQEREKDFHNHIFEAKLKAFKKLLRLIFEMNDDHVITEMEIKGVENQAGIVALIAGEDLVSILAQFVNQLKTYGRIYYRNMDEGQVAKYIDSIGDFIIQPDATHAYLCPKKHKLYSDGILINENDAGRLFVSLDEVVQAMRDDLAVVEGNIEQMLAAFVLVPFDAHELMRSPNMAQ